MTTFLHDIRYGFRMLLKQKGFTAVAVIALALGKQFHETNTGWDVFVSTLHERLVREVKPSLLALLGAVGFVLLIACADVATR